MAQAAPPRQMKFGRRPRTKIRTEIQPPHAARRVWPPRPSSVIFCSSRSTPATWHCAMVRALAPHLLLQRLDADFRKHGFRNVRFAAGTCRHDSNSQGQCVDVGEGVSAPVIPSAQAFSPKLWLLGMHVGRDCSVSGQEGGSLAPTCGNVRLLPVLSRCGGQQEGGCLRWRDTRCF